MIEYIGRSGEPEAMNCPALICDACREQVVNDGTAYWAVRYDGEQRSSSPVFISHKFPCYQLVEAMIDDQFPLAEGWSGPLSDEALAFMRHLTNNFRHAFADDAAGRYHDHELVQPETTMASRSLRARFSSMRKKEQR